MLKLKLLISVLLVTNVRTTNFEPGETSRTQDETSNLKGRDELREKIVESLTEIPESETISLSATSEYTHFDPCRAEIDRSLLCEAINIRMNRRTRRIIDEPCLNQTGDAYFKCTTEDAVVLHLKTQQKENRVILEIEKHVYKAFTVPLNIQPLLVNPYYRRYNSLAKWIDNSKPSAEEITSKIEETDFPTAYALALKLEIVDVTEELQQSGDPKGPPVCNVVFDRGVYCEAVNIRLHGQTFPRKNSPCKCSNAGVPYYLCKMATGVVLSMERGDNETDVYLKNSENKIVYVVKSLPLHEYFMNKYILPGNVTDKLEMMDLWKKMMLPVPAPDNPMEAFARHPPPPPPFPLDVVMLDAYVNADRCTIS